MLVATMVRTGPPVWAESRVDLGEAVEYWRRVGEVRSAEGHEAIGVEIVRRDERAAGPGGEPAEAVGETQLLVACLRLSLDDALSLAGLVTSAVERARAPF